MMGERAGSGMPEQHTEHRVDDPKEEYGDLDTLLMVERLDEHFDEVKKQLDEVRGLIKKYNGFRDKLKDDPDVEVYVDEYYLKIDTALSNFTFNGKKLDIRKLAHGFGHEEVFKDMVAAVNDQVEFLRKTGKQVEYITTL